MPKNLYVLCGRLEGWDNDVARIIPANNSDQATNVFVTDKLLADNGYELGDRDFYVHQCELLGELIADGLLLVAEGVLE